MGRKKILFVTYNDCYADEGISYVIDLARTLDQDLSVLLVAKAARRLADYFAAAALAEEGNPGGALELLRGDSPERRNEKLATIFERCAASGVTVNVNVRDEVASSAIKRKLKETPAIEIVLLSPSIMEYGDVPARNLRKLLKSVSRPFVTMTRHGNAQSIAKHGVTH